MKTYLISVVCSDATTYSEKRLMPLPMELQTFIKNKGKSIL